MTAPLDPRLPGGGGYTVGPLYNLNPNVFGQSNLLIESTQKVGDDTRVFNGVDATFNVRNTHEFTFSGGTSTGKVVNDFCAIRAAVPENYLLNPFCHQESPYQTSVRFLAAYTIPHVDVLVSTVFQDKPNIGTDQLASLSATYTPTAADLASAQAQLGPSADRRSGYLQRDEQQRHARVHPDVPSERHGLAGADVLHEPARVPSERRIRVLTKMRC